MLIDGSEGLVLRRILPFVAAVAAAGLAGCGSSTNPPISTAVTCNPSTVTLSAATSAIVRCDSGTTVQLAGNGASYVIVPNLATGNKAPYVAVSYTLSVNAGGSSVERVPPQPIAAGAGPRFFRAAAATGSEGLPGGGGQAQHEFHDRLRALQHQLVGKYRGNIARIRASRVRPSLAVNCCPPAGSVQTFHVLASESPNKFQAVQATLSYVGTNLLLYIDNASPTPGFSASQLTAFGQYFDQTLFPLDSIFGATTDIDNNGHVIMLLSPVVNALTPKAQCSSGYVGGFFFGNDLINTDTTSNKGEIFYSIVPDSAGTVSCAHSVAAVESVVDDVFLHELQHLINFGQHVLTSGGNEEIGWLDEGESIVAEEQGSIHYEQKYPAPTGRTNASQLFPDSSQDFIGGILYDMYQYLLRPDTESVTLHSDADCCIPWRGGDWMFLRWLGDQYGNGYYKKLEHNLQTDTANLAFSAGTGFRNLFGNFSMSLWTDSLVGVAKSTIPTTNKFLSRNLRLLNNREFTVEQANGASGFPRPWPVVITQLTATGTTATLVPGSAAFYRLDTSASAATVTVTFAGSTGKPVAANFLPQLTIFRLPPGS